MQISDRRLCTIGPGCFIPMVVEAHRGPPHRETTRSADNTSGLGPALRVVNHAGLWGPRSDAARWQIHKKWSHWPIGVGFSPAPDRSSTSGLPPMPRADDHQWTLSKRENDRSHPSLANRNWQRVAASWTSLVLADRAVLADLANWTMPDRPTQIFLLLKGGGVGSNFFNSKYPPQLNLFYIGTPSPKSCLIRWAWYGKS